MALGDHADTTTGAGHTGGSEVMGHLVCEKTSDPLKQVLEPFVYELFCGEIYL
jgi:hypothetical protein